MSQLIATWLPTIVRIAGLGQLVLIVASLAIPRILGWKEEMAKLRPLTRQVFWTYAGYIWATNLAFGLLSALAPHWLSDQSGLSATVPSFIAVYWFPRLILLSHYSHHHLLQTAPSPPFL